MNFSEGTQELPERAALPFGPQAQLTMQVIIVAAHWHQGQLWEQ